MDASQLAKSQQIAAKDAIAAILHQLQIAKVFIIDDVYEAPPDTGQVISWFTAALTAERSKCIELMPTVDFNKPDEVWKIDLSREWENLEIENQLKLATSLSQLLPNHGNLLGRDFVDVLAIRDSFPRKFRPTELGPSEWTAQQKSILTAASSSARILCLFDQDLHNASGFASDGPRSGIGLLADVVRAYPEGEIICGLLSHTLSLDNERSRWMELANMGGLKVGQFLPLAKVRLENPLLFADGIKKTAMNIFCERLKDRAIAITELAVKQASQDLAQLDVYTFDRMILESSQTEGIWEVDTLFRVFRIFQRDATKEISLETSNCAAFNEDVQRVRKLRSVVAGEYHRGTSPGQRWEVRHQELYESDQLINELHSPLETGDLFELSKIDGTRSTYILIAQPCDLMIRKDGTRHARTVPLVPVILPPASMSDKDLNYLRVRSILRYFEKGTDQVRVVDFPDAGLISVEVLDLAVFSSTGKCYIDLTRQEEEPPPQLTDGLIKHRPNIITHFDKIGKKLDELHSHLASLDLDETIRQTLLQEVMPKVSLTEWGLPPNPYNQGAFDFGLRRIGRYRQPGASVLLSEYSHYLARVAEEVDFGE